MFQWSNDRGLRLGLLSRYLASQNKAPTARLEAGSITANLNSELGDSDSSIFETPSGIWLMPNQLDLDFNISMSPFDIRYASPPDAPMPDFAT
jgi:hypothetical protein